MLRAVSKRESRAAGSSPISSRSESSPSSGGRSITARVDAILTGGDCEGTAHAPTVAPQPGILIQNIIGDKNQATTAGSPDLSKTQQLNERLTTLRDLYNRKLISKDVYEQESQKAIRESE